MTARGTFINTRFTTTFGDVFVSKQTRPDIGEPAPEFPVFFVTVSQGTITPHIFFTDATLADWDFGDGTTVSGDNNPSHTYTDGQPSHEVRLPGVDLSKVDQLQIGGDGITSIDLLNTPNLRILYAGSSPGLDIPALPNAANFQILNLLGNGQTSPLDLSAFSSLDRIILGGCAGLASLTLPVSAPAVFRLYVNNTSLSFIDISGLPGLSDVPMFNAQFTAAVIDDVLIKLDGFGKNNGSLNYNGNPGAPTLAALTAYNNLISKGWTITGPVPA